MFNKNKVILTIADELKESAHEAIDTFFNTLSEKLSSKKEETNTNDIEETKKEDKSSLINNIMSSITDNIFKKKDDPKSIGNRVISGLKKTGSVFPINTSLGVIIIDDDIYITKRNKKYQIFYKDKNVSEEVEKAVPKIWASISKIIKENTDKQFN